MLTLEERVALLKKKFIGVNITARQLEDAFTKARITKKSVVFLKECER